MPEPSPMEVVGVQFFELSWGEGRKSGDIQEWIFGECSSFHGVQSHAQIPGITKISRNRPARDVLNAGFDLKVFPGLACKS